VRGSCIFERSRFHRVARFDVVMGERGLRSARGGSCSLA
jgi:hypothetical protein